mmetsp:Transcript_20145/g.29619  ORF Transcript_20145/g.29619 Transcript_20145/m.29619 type:complete len:212 (+) Transcript_20145:279-914(+)
MGSPRLKSFMYLDFLITIRIKPKDAGWLFHHILENGHWFFTDSVFLAHSRHGINSELFQHLSPQVLSHKNVTLVRVKFKKVTLLDERANPYIFARLFILPEEFHRSRAMIDETRDGCFLDQLGDNDINHRLASSGLVDVKFLEILTSIVVGNKYVSGVRFHNFVSAPWESVGYWLLVAIRGIAPVHGNGHIVFQCIGEPYGYFGFCKETEW